MTKGGYRHGVPGGDAAKERVEARLTPDVKARWVAAAGRAGYGPREMTAFLVEAVEAFIIARKLEP